MIFVTVGSQKFQFNRLLQYIDILVEKQAIQDEVFAQTGYSDYQPKNYTHKDFLDRGEFNQKIVECELVITHGGTGTIMGAVKAGKKVIAVPRLRRYGEHIDDHQEQIIKQLISENIIIGISQLEDIEVVIKKSNTIPVVAYVSNTAAIIESIDKYIFKTISNR